MFNAKIRLRDRVWLHATIYKPGGSAKPHPAIVTITPYQADSYHEQGRYFADNGYVFVMVDSRGRGNSEGEFEPFAGDGKDGYDVVEWTAKQPWCNGSVGMWGGSYGGFIQWATLKEAPPHLKTIVPFASACPGVDFPAPGGIADAYFMRWMILTLGKYNNRKIFEDADFWIAKFRERYLQHRPFCSLDKIVGNQNKHWRKWLKHREPSDYWNTKVPGKDDYAKFDIPIMTITGHYDSDQLGAMAYFHRHMKHGSDAAKKKHYLIMGPWDHAGTLKPKQEVGGVKFGKSSMLDMNKLQKSWYDWTMNDGIKPIHITNRITYYVAGLESWQSTSKLANIPGMRRKYYLHSDGKANDVFHSGELVTDMSDKSPPDSYLYDPLDTRPATWESEKHEAFLTDQRQVMNLNGKGLIYHTKPMPNTIEITGYCKFVAWIKLNVPDTDFQARLFEVQPDGKSILLSQDRLRARYRKSLDQAKLVKPGEINRYEFNNFFFISRQIKKGSRLRLLFTSPNSIYLEKNYNSGGAVEHETAKDARTAEVVLYHDLERQSFIDIPVGKVLR